MLRPAEMARATSAGTQTQETVRMTLIVRWGFRREEDRRMKDNAVAKAAMTALELMMNERSVASGCD